MAELMGKKTGFCKGRGGSMHIVDMSKGKVVFNGTIPYDEKTDIEVDKITGIEKDILINSINWFCE